MGAAAALLSSASDAVGEYQAWKATGLFRGWQAINPIHLAT